MEFGQPISMNPSIKINDSMSVFISYIFGFNSAVKQYIKPEPLICPFILDLWIIPNRTIRVHNNTETEIDNDIGNILQRLKQNKVKYSKQSCVPDDISKFTKQITSCLSKKKY
eukprot:158852_1